jgi:beta-glucosidase/6-phospho-beta-glucosidase/beta-galactosidase
MKISVGIEGTFAPQSGQDTLRITGHFHRERWKADFASVVALGMNEVRYGIPWHAIETSEGEYDWREIEPILRYAIDELGLSVIADPLHHTSYPEWLTGGFLDPRFAGAYRCFVETFAERMPEVTTYTPINEPTCTLDFCGYRGFWHPYASGDQPYVGKLRNTARATAEVILALKRHNPAMYILHVDTFQHHRAGDQESKSVAELLNERRFVFDELVLGRVGRDHPLYAYLLEHGFSARDLEWHAEHPATYDERGGNYYPLNEEELFEGGAIRRAPSNHPRGLAAVARDYAQRLQLPLSLTETNIQGTPHDRISWLKYSLGECERLVASGVPLERFAWYPLFDCAGWCSLLQADVWDRDPQGILSCDVHWHRYATEFTEAYARVVGGARSTELPAYRFSARHERTLAALSRQMNWDWLEERSLAARLAA